MDALYDSLAGLSSFALYFVISIVAFFVFKIVYAFVTPHDEWQLVRDEQNIAAAIGFGGAMIGFAIALAGAISNSEFLLDYAIWALIATFAQILAFLILRFTFMPKIAERIANNEVSAGIILACVSIAIGLINAACMTY
uniref:DUF350 domain-containing protein n=1 Tax=Ningiella ruwaisensis TaxID=2364274 RepID=UPI0010A0B206|nr:DUF350 domain-containing protein [Ningiella ruwaisensis]